MSSHRYYQTLFAKLRYQYVKNMDMMPTDCVITPEIYNKLVFESMGCNQPYFTKEEIDTNLSSSEICCMGVKIKRGYGCSDFNFYTIEERRND